MFFQPPLYGGQLNLGQDLNSQQLYISEFSNEEYLLSENPESQLLKDKILKRLDTLTKWAIIRLFPGIIKIIYIKPYFQPKFLHIDKINDRDVFNIVVYYVFIYHTFLMMISNIIQIISLRQIKKMVRDQLIHQLPDQVRHLYSIGPDDSYVPFMNNSKLYYKLLLWINIILSIVIIIPLLLVQSNTFNIFTEFRFDNPDAILNIQFLYGATLLLLSFYSGILRWFLVIQFLIGICFCENHPAATFMIFLIVVSTYISCFPFLYFFNRCIEREMKLEKAFYSKANLKNLKSPTCSICLELYQNEENIVQFPCHESHFFHYKCTLSWWKIQKSCPLCKKLYYIDQNEFFQKADKNCKIFRFLGQKIGAIYDKFITDMKDCKKFLLIIYLGMNW